MDSQAAAEISGRRPSALAAGETDIIDLFMDLTSGTRSPEIFRLWSAIAMIAGALERRVWIANGDSTTFPNLYVLLVAPPGVGKWIVELVRELWADTTKPGQILRAFTVASDSVTFASIVDEMEAARTTFIPPTGGPITYHSLLVTAEEFGLLIPQFSSEIVDKLNALWSNKTEYSESRRTGKKKVKIPNPQLNILAGIQPSTMASRFPDDLWDTGIGRRLLMIYSSEGPRLKLFHRSRDTSQDKEKLLQILSRLSGLFGPVEVDAEAEDRLETWYANGQEPVPNHSKLTHYNTTRGLYALKLSLIAAIARSREKIIRLQDVERALAWLFEAERRMPDIFRAMMGRSDRDVIDELHRFAIGCFAKDRKAIPGDRLRRFLLERVPHEKIETILQAADKARLVQRVAGTDDAWVPKPKYDPGVE